MWDWKDAAYDFYWQNWLSSYRGWFWHRQKTTRSEGQLMYKTIEENDIWALKPHTYLSPGSVIISCKRLVWLGANELACPVPRALIKSNCSHKIDNRKHIGPPHSRNAQGTCQTWAENLNHQWKYETWAIYFRLSLPSMRSPAAHPSPRMGWSSYPSLVIFLLFYNWRHI